MTTHSTLSPSARHRWGKCPASVRVLKGYEGSGKQSPAAVDGTHSHTLLEHCIKHAPPGTIDDPEKFLGTIMADHEGSFPVDAYRIERVRVATNYIRSRLTPESVLVSESRVDPELFFNRTDLSGTVDVQIITGDTLEVIDYKDGIHPVDVVNNPQLEQYVFGALAANHPKTFDIVITTIIQPKLAIRGGEAITSHLQSSITFFGQKMLLLANEAAATDDPNAPFVPGEQCGWCPHKPNCSTSVTWMLGKAGIKFDDMTITKDAAKTVAPELSNEQLREIIEAGPLLRKLIEEVEGEVLKRILSGRDIEGLKVVRSTGRRKWALPEDEIAAKLSKMGVPKSDIWETKLSSFTKIEKLTWTKRDGTQKQLTPRQREIFNSTLVEKPDGALVVVPSADNREAVKQFDASAMFSPVVPAGPSWMA